MSVLALWTAVTLAGFLIGCLAKAIRYATMPLHVRWELYPVAHEKGKAAYGGSYFEELDWWTKPRRVSHFGELKVMAEEVLTLKAVRENNPSLWLASLFFHYGLYLLFTLGGALAFGAVARIAGIGPMRIVSGGRALSAVGFVGLALATSGAAALLLRRALDGSLRRASTPADFFHLVLLLAVFVSSWGAWLTADRHYALAASYLVALPRFSPTPTAGGWVAAELSLLGVFLVYLPFSHMAHMFTKYFTWHSVRWEDTPNLAGSGIDAKVAKLLVLPVSWAAPHIRGDGHRTWADVVQDKGEA
jgi:nitrate reductase gamma subunit